ncbi:hypothetical protein PO909_019556 [Leuciscus waleckii]
MWTLPRTRFAHCNDSSSSDEKEIAVNIGGVRLVLCGDILNRYPDSRLAELVNCTTRSFDVISSLCDDYDPGKREFYFDRDPDSSRVIAVVSFLFILVSSVVMCLGTIPDLQVEDSEGNRVEHPTLDAIETACIGWFTVEYVLRLASSPNKLRFALSFMNMIDFLAVLPFYVVLVLTYLGTAMMELANVQQAVQALRIMRIARIFKLARHSSGLQTLTYALKRSFKELGLLLMYMGVGIFVFSALGYTMEQSHPETLFRSIPQSFWWAIITMTTVGYGDIYPKTTLGRCNAAISFLCGVIAIALPIHPIINNFVIYYNKQKVLETAAKHELELMELRALELAVKSTSRRSDAPGCAWEGALRASRSDTFIPLLYGAHRTEKEPVKKKSLT